MLQKFPAPGISPAGTDWDSRAESSRIAFLSEDGVMLAAAVRASDALGLLNGKPCATWGLPERGLPELINGPVGTVPGLNVARKPGRFVRTAGPNQATGEG